MPKVTRESQNGPAPARRGKTGDIRDLIRPVSERTKLNQVFIYGESGCLAGDAFINYQVRDPTSGRIQNSKGGSLELLYRRFNNLPRKGKGYYQRKQTRGSSFYVASITDEGRITQNLVTGVIDSGDRQVLEVVTESGKVLKATANHEFMTEAGYRPLGTLRRGDSVLVHPGKRMKVANPSVPVYRPEVLVKNHSGNRIKVVSGYTYYRLPRAHFVYEAYQNEMSLEEYREFLNTASPEEVARLWTVPQGAEIHHMDEDPLNDVIENLMLTGSSSEHQKEFHTDSNITRPGMSIYVVPDRVMSVRRLGTERVYDIVVADPFRNFVANGFAVHNSGKTRLACKWPKPLLLVGAEDGTESVRNVEGVEFIRLRDIDQVSDLVRLCQSDPPPFKTVVLDTLTSFHGMVLAKVKGIEELPAQRSYGDATRDEYREASFVTKQHVRDLLRLAERKMAHVVVLAHEKLIKGKDEGLDPRLVSPKIMGAAGESVVNFVNAECDYVLHTETQGKYKVTRMEVDGQVEEIREPMEGAVFCLRLTPNNYYVCKFRAPEGVVVPEIIEDPTYEKLRRLMEGQTVKPTRKGGA